MSFESTTPIAVSPSPSDSVSQVAFSPCGSWLLVTGWSGELGLHASAHGTQIASTSLPCPVLGAAWNESRNEIFSAALDGNVYATRLTASSFEASTPIGAPHARAASCVLATSNGVIVSGSWDATLHLHDTRRDEFCAKAQPAVVIDAGAKVFSCCSIDGDHCFAFVTSEKQARIVDVRKPSEFVHDISPAFGAPLRVVDAFSKRHVLVIGSTDGRVAVESFDGGKSPSYAFKCHRLDGRAYPVNAIAHNRTHGTFVTGGGDGYLNVWDGLARKRIYQYPRAATSIASLSFSPDDRHLAVAVSYTFEEGERDHPQDAVFIRPVSDAEFRSRDGLTGTSIS